MDRNMKNNINELTETILILYKINPVRDNICDIVTKLGGSVKTDGLLSYYSDCKIEKRDDSFVIYVPMNQPEKRLKGVVANALGYLIIHLGYKINKDLWSSFPNKTYDCEHNEKTNEFSASLLMPKWEYRKKIDEFTDDRQVNISEVARYFGVYADLASFRGKSLGILR